MIKHIYYSKKMAAYYFLSSNAFGDETEIHKVYGGEKLKGAPIREDKNGRKYIVAEIKETIGKKGYTYFEVVGPYIKRDTDSHE